MGRIIKILFLPLIKINNVWFGKINIVKKLFKLFLYSILASIWFLIWLFVLNIIFEILKLNQKYILQVVILIFVSVFGAYSFTKNNKKLNLLSLFSLILILLIITTTFIITTNYIAGNSMSPAIKDKQRVITFKLDRKYNKGDVIIFEDPKNNLSYISRIIALGGDKLMVKEGKVYLNGDQLQESYTTMVTSPWKDGFIKEAVEITVPIDQVFVMGDNRSKSNDSREWGYFPTTKIIGKVVYVF